jgi:hypothetical protein
VGSPRRFCPLALVVALAFALAVRARVADADGTRRAPPRRALVVVLPGAGLSELQRRAVEDAVAAGVVVARSAAIVPDRSGAEPGVARAELSHADRLAEDAVKALESFELDLAVESLHRAITAYIDRVPDLVARDGTVRALVDAHRQLAIAQFLSGDEDSAQRALAHCFALAGDLDYSPALFPPQMEELVVSGRLFVDEVGPGGLEVLATGGTATVFINGQDHGPAPAVVEDLRPGPNLVSLVVAGAAPVTRIVEVESGERKLVEVAAPSPPVSVPATLLTLRRALTRRGRLSRSVQAKLDEVARRADAEVVVVVVGGIDRERRLWRAIVYDRRNRRVVARAVTEADVAARDAAGFARPWSRALWAGTDWGRHEPAGGLVGLWRRARAHEHFWPAVGVTGGVIATAVIVGLIAARRGPSPERVVVLGVAARF